MVVNRKQPAAPVPLVQSRSNSQQSIIMRKKQSKFITSNGINVQSHKPLSRNPNPQATSRQQPHPRKKSLVIFWLLSLFACYSFFFCSPYTTTPQKSHSHLICRAETNYKTYILEPFILPPLKHTFTLTHSFAKPYISQANTHLEPYLAPVRQATTTVKPYVIQAATTTKRVWKDTLTPFYKNTLKPYYKFAIVPRYNLYLRPYLSPLITQLERYYAYYISNPIRIQSNRVKLYLSTPYAHVHSYISHLQPYIQRFASTIYTAWLSSVDFYGTRIHPTIVSAWIQAQPHLYFAFNQAKVLSLNAAAGTAKHLKGLAKQVGTQRRTYVDPHIRKIWDKVEENATMKMTTVPPAPADISLEQETAAPTIIESLSSSGSPMVLEATKITNTKESDTPHISVPVPEEDIQGVLPSVASTPPPPTPSLHSASIQSAVSIAEASAHAASTAVHELEREVESLGSGPAADTTSGIVESSEVEVEQIRAEAEVKPNKEETSSEPATSTSSLKESAESTVETSLGGATTFTPSAGVAAGGVMGASASVPSSTAGEDDLEDFLRDIGIGTPSSPTLIPDQPSEVDEVAAAQEAESSRLASIASKRQAINTRHTALEFDLQNSIQNSTSQIIEKLKEVREAKKEELAALVEDTGAEGWIGGLTLRADKLMKGLEVYLKKCEGRSGNWKRGVGEGEEEGDIQERTGLAKDEQTQLESVIEKVEIKFSDVVQKLQEQVNEWYVNAIEREQEEISKITIKIKNMAEEAQASLGLDYAWLEDVTYADWQRYHDLMRTFENFEQIANAIQNGSSLEPPSPPNPVKPVINALQEELQTVVLGFYVALGRVRDMIPELFDIYESVPAPEHEEGAGVGEGEEEEDRVTIQPVDPGPDSDSENGKEKTGQNEESFDASKVIIGKSKEQIEQALGGVPLVVEHEEL